ncbi:hypothetical protein HN51_004814 [Arachis hypogaea]|nr:uncharacterized protein LOC107484284 [Arachis duranensis]XP_020996095.1 uncharacterized protein LOC107484284 [Arachis duranensis]XP_025695096.1 uncharacterized protein LOC112796729 [Arachis hypogaea]QHO38462.1 uncharacterized protein DS421_4g120610 [Arachis hypogaea]RYR62462.1 hypothetical protein Ahy_A04g020068 isoform B [Arachis hypogaea]
MESTSSRINDPNTKPFSKRLLFDRRYGWVIDEWKDPSEEALDGGRGMFCVFPLVKALVQKVSQSINLAATSAMKVSEQQQLFPHQMLQHALDDGVHDLMSSLKNAGYKGFILNNNSQPRVSSNSTQQDTASNE